MHLWLARKYSLTASKVVVPWIWLKDEKQPFYVISTTFIYTGALWIILIIKHGYILTSAIFSPKVHWWNSKAHLWLLRTNILHCLNASINSSNHHCYHYIIHTQNDCPCGRVTHICVGKLTIIGSDNGLSPGWCQAIIWRNVWILLIGPLGTNFSRILIKIHIFSFKKMHLKMSAKWQPFCLGLNVHTQQWHPFIIFNGPPTYWHPNKMANIYKWQFQKDFLTEKFDVSNQCS